ncbi:MAG: ABC transporter substrate-binding protein [Anaerolineae bacterium]|nr:ABC transporter substrate-binding protein [Anaerolineae bacterium]
MRVKHRYLVFLIVLLSSCALPSSPKPLLKIGLVAPFEGRDRALGYEALGAVKEALAARNAAGGVAGYMIELVALNDNNAPDESAFQARELAVDKDVVGAIGPFSEGALAAAAPVYDELGLPLIAPVSTDGQPHPAVFSLAAGADALAAALLAQLPVDARPALIRAGNGPLGNALQPAIDWVVDDPQDLADLARKLHLARWRPPSHILFDGDALTAAELLLELRAIDANQPFLGGPSLARTQLPQIAGDAARNACYAIAVPTSSERTPWAALAYDAANLLLEALEKTIRAEGAPSRQGVSRQNVSRQNVMNQLAAGFAEHRRANISIKLYCYGADPAYPGQPIR